MRQLKSLAQLFLRLAKPATSWRVKKDVLWWEKESKKTRNKKAERAEFNAVLTT
jgi:hypothetical protein